MYKRFLIDDSYFKNSFFQMARAANLDLRDVFKKRWDIFNGH